MTIVTLEETHTYRCNHTQTDRISWQVNGSRLNVEIFPLNIATEIIQLPDGSRVYTLTIGSLSEHNDTTIQCIAQIDDGSIREATSIVKFLIQGTYDQLVLENNNMSLIVIN